MIHSLAIQQRDVLSARGISGREGAVRGCNEEARRIPPNQHPCSAPSTVDYLRLYRRP